MVPAEVVVVAAVVVVAEVPEVVVVAEVPEVVVVPAPGQFPGYPILVMGNKLKVLL